MPNYPFISVHQPDEGQQGHYNDGYSPYPPANHYDQPNYASNPFSTPQDHQSYPQHAQDYQQQSYPPVGHDPFNAPYRQSPSPSHPDSYSSSYTLHSTPQPSQQYQLQPHQQQPLGSFPPDPSFSTSDLTVPPLPSLSNQTSTTAFQPYEDEHGMDDMGDLPLLRAPSGRSQESLSMNMRMPGQYGASLDDNNIRYGRIPQRVPRRYKTLKRIECVSYLSHLHIMSAHHPLISLFLTQTLPRQFCA
jgi:chitin synthase